MIIISYVYEMQFKVFLIISLLISFASLESQSSEHVFKSEPQYYEIVRKLIPHLQTERLESFVRKFSSFPDRDPTNLENDAERWLLEEISASIQNYKVGPTSTSQIAADSFFKLIQENHIARLEGHDPVLKKELIILGAHYDTRKQLRGRKVPGADDNATGCAVLLEVLRLLAQFGIKLKRSLEFHFYTGNAGYSSRPGSEKVIKEFKNEDKIRLVKAMLNLDKLGYKIQGSRDSIGVVDNYEFEDFDGGKGRVTSAALTSFVKMLIKEYTVVEMKEATQCSSRCTSDNFNWHKAGAPAACVTEVSEKARFHWFEDFIEDVSFAQVQEFAKIAVAFVIELAELAEIPNLPDLPLARTRERGSRSFAVKTEVGWIAMGAAFIGILLLVRDNFHQ